MMLYSKKTPAIGVFLFRVDDDAPPGINFLGRGQFDFKAITNLLASRANSQAIWIRAGCVIVHIAKDEPPIGF